MHHEEVKQKGAAVQLELAHSSATKAKARWATIALVFTEAKKAETSCPATKTKEVKLDMQKLKLQQYRPAKIPLLHQKG